MVEGVREGTVTEDYLRRIVWGPDGIPNNGPPPAMTEYHVSSAMTKESKLDWKVLKNRQTSRKGEEDEDEKAEIEMGEDQKTSQSAGTSRRMPCYRWREIAPISVSIPFVPGTDATTRFDTFDKSTFSKSPNLLQLPWLPWKRKAAQKALSAATRGDEVEAATGKCGSDPLNDNATELGAIKRVRKTAARQMDTVFVIEMPYRPTAPISALTSISPLIPSQAQIQSRSHAQPTPQSNHDTNPNSNPDQFAETQIKVVQLPLTLASISPIFQEDVNDTIPLHPPDRSWVPPILETGHRRQTGLGYAGALSSVARARTVD
jgi:hypothetical protein